MKDLIKVTLYLAMYLGMGIIYLIVISVGNYLLMNKIITLHWEWLIHPYYIGLVVIADYIVSNLGRYYKDIINSL